MIDELRCCICGIPLDTEGLCPRCESQQDLMFGENWSQNKTNQSDIQYHDEINECLCPICSGNPSADPIFKYLFDYDMADYGSGYGSHIPSSHSHDRFSHISSQTSTKPDSGINFPRYLAFDIEIAQAIPDGVQDWSKYRPFGISCAATLTSDGKTNLWYGKSPTSDYASHMSEDEVKSLVEYLKTTSLSGYKLLTWNGLGFDFDILSEESGMHADCKHLAFNHIDMMFHIFCQKGYPLGLDKAAKGMGLPGKPHGMSGELAPRLWKEGRFRDVLEYVRQDVQTIVDLATVIDRQRQLRWISNKGNPQSLSIPSGWLTVQEALKLPIPDTSWMSNPWPRSKFTKWLVSEDNKINNKGRKGTILDRITSFFSN